jgi:hypothetical protein
MGQQRCFCVVAECWKVKERIEFGWNGEKTGKDSACREVSVMLFEIKVAEKRGSEGVEVALKSGLCEDERALCFAAVEFVCTETKSSAFGLLFQSQKNNGHF